MTKKEIIARIQEIANSHLGFRSLNFSNYIQLNKAELEVRLATAEEMHKLDIEIEKLEAKHTKQEWDVVATFPSSCKTDLVEDHKILDNLIRQSMDLWLKV